jgi:competence protein ComEC
MLVAIGHYLVNPSAPQSISFQLSYTAVFAILLALQKNNAEQLLLQYSFRGHTRKGNWFFVPVQISLAAWSATLPIVQGAFGGSSPYFLFGNLLVVPLITLMIWASVPLLIFGRVFPSGIKEWYASTWDILINGAETLLLFLEQLRQTYS